MAVEDHTVGIARQKPPHRVANQAKSRMASDPLPRQILEGVGRIDRMDLEVFPLTR